MAEPSYEELKARVAELESKSTGRRTGRIGISRRRKRRRQRLRPGAVSRHTLLRAVDSAAEFRGEAASVSRRAQREGRAEAQAEIEIPERPPVAHSTSSDRRNRGWIFALADSLALRGARKDRSTGRESPGRTTGNGHRGGDSSERRARSGESEARRTSGRSCCRRR